MFISASCVIGLGLEVEASGKAIVWENSSLGSRVRVGQIGQDCKLKISEILLMVDPRDWGITAWHHCIHAHGDIALSRVWVHGVDIHHS